MSLISLRLPDELLVEVDAMASQVHMARAQYIRQAIEHMNGQLTQELKQKHLAQLSLRVRHNSMDVLKDFEAIEKDLDV